LGDGRIIHATAPKDGGFYHSDDGTAHGDVNGEPEKRVDIGDVKTDSFDSKIGSGYIAVLIRAVENAGGYSSSSTIQPDLDARNGDPDFAATLSASTVAQGTSVTMTYRLSNWGPGDNAGGSVTGIYLSTNSVFDTGDTLLTTDAVGALAANVGSTETVVISTSNIPAGNYYIFAVADAAQAIAEVNETNNPSNGVALTITGVSASPGSVSIDNQTVSEGNAGTKVLTFTVTRSGGAAAFDVNFATSNGGATTADSDYVANSGTLHFDANINTQPISITINGDTKVESDEAFFVLLSNATNGATISNNLGIGTILNDDGGSQTPTLTLSPATVTHSEGNAGTATDFTFVVTMSGTSNQEVTAQWFTTWSTTFDLADFSGAYNGNLSFMPGGPTSQTITMHVLGDNVAEPDESFLVHLINAGGAQIDGNAWLATGIVVNDDGAVVGSVAINDVTLTEGDAGTKVAVFTVTRSGGTAAFDVNFVTSDGTATVADGDYTTRSGSLHFGDNVNTQTISVSINGDNKLELDETFFVNLSGPTNGATISDNLGIGTITNDDASSIAGSVSINDVSITEGDSGRKPMTFTVTRTDGTAPFDVQYAVGQTAFDGLVDVNADVGTLHFDSGVNTRSIVATIFSDTIVEPDEFFRVTLYNATNGAIISDGEGVGTIINDDFAGSVSINDISVAEGDSGTKVMTFTVTRTGGSAAFAVNFATSDGTATVANGDYLSNSGTLVFGDAVNSQTVTVAINGDRRFESNETLFINLSGATNGATISDGQGIGTILNDDLPTLAPARLIDLDGDKKSDVVWRDDGGLDYGWLMNGLSLKAEGGLRAVDTSWHMRGGGDFDGDGKGDILWRQDGGQVYLWNMNGTAIKNEGAVRLVDTPWHIDGTGDFSGDGREDVIWRHDNGQVYVWNMNGASVISEGSIRSVDNAWHINATGDFDGDGKFDVLWRHDSGLNYLWTMNGTSLKGEGALRAVDTSWHIQGAGDFDGDGKDDLLWRQDGGQVYVWLMNGQGIKAEGGLRAVDNTWHIQATGDVDGDGKDDILWQHDSGLTYIWEMNGVGVKAEGAQRAASSNWHILGHDFDLI
jgi:hypothetical protein